MAPAKRAKRGRRTGSKCPGSDSQVERIRLALIELVGERGYPMTNLADLLERAGVKVAEFDRHYPSLDACFADVWEGFSRELVDRTTAAYVAQESWQDGMRAVSWEFYRFLAEDPRRARICLIEVNFGGELAQADRDLLMEICIDAIHRGRFEEEGRDGVPRARAEAILGAIWERVVARIMEDDLDALIDVVPEILYLMVLPYRGPEAAGEELRRGREDVAHRRGENS